MRCSSVLRRIDQLRTSELDRNESNELTTHFETCSTCSDSYDELDRFADLVRRLGQESDSEPGVAGQFERVTTESGSAWVVFSSRGIRMISRQAQNESELRERYCEQFGGRLEPGVLPENLREQVVDALRGAGCPAPAVDLSTLGEFERDVLTVIARIPRGEVRPYSWVAREIGRPGAVRAVGNALHRNPVAPVLPCHRVVPSTGGVGNYALGTSRKIELLKREGVDVAELERLARLGIRFVGLRSGTFCFPTCERVRESDAADRVPIRHYADAERRGFVACDRCRPAALSA